MVWLMLFVWATAAILVALMWGKLVQWGEIGDCERIRRSPRKIQRCAPPAGNGKSDPKANRL